jgi:hypothetical protein
MHWHFCEFSITEENFAAVWTHEADHHVEGRCLARSVRTKETDHFASLHFERNVPYDRPAGVGFGEPRGLQALS